MATSTTTTQPIDLEFELTQGSASRIIRAKARRLIGHGRLTTSDLDDLRQQLTLALIMAVDKFDPKIAEWEAFVSTIIERSADKLLIKRKAKRREHRHHVTSLSSLVEDEDGQQVALGTQLQELHRESMTGRYGSSEHEHVEIRDEACMLMEQMSEETLRLCESLETQSLTQASQTLDICKKTARKRLNQVQREFREE